MKVNLQVSKEKTYRVTQTQHSKKQKKNKKKKIITKGFGFPKHLLVFIIYPVYFAEKVYLLRPPWPHRPQSQWGKLISQGLFRDIAGNCSAAVLSISIFKQN